MKRILATVALIATLATSAHAVWTPPITRGRVYSYNPSYVKPIRTVSTWYRGWSITRIVTVTDPATGCVTTTTTLYAFFTSVNETVATVCP